MARGEEPLESIGGYMSRRFKGAAQSSNPGPTIRREEVRECYCDTCKADFQGSVLLSGDRVLYRSHECPACRQDREALDRQETRETQARQILEQQACWRLQCGMAPQLRDKRFDNFNIEAQRPAYEAVYSWVTEMPIEYPRGYRSLLLYSDPGVYGVGKTHLLAAAANWLITNCPTDVDNPVCPVRFETGTSLVRRIRATYNLKDEDRPYHETEETLYNSLSGVGLLILDDVREETASRHSREVYYHIINERVNCGLPVMLSSNMNPESPQFADVVGAATVSRLLGMVGGICYRLTGQDMRLKRKVP